MLPSVLRLWAVCCLIPLFGIQVVQVMWGTKFAPETCGAALGFGQPLRDDRTDSSATKLWIFPAQFAQVIAFVVTCFNMLHMDLQIAWVLSWSQAFKSLCVHVVPCSSLYKPLEVTWITYWGYWMAYTKDARGNTKVLQSLACEMHHFMNGLAKVRHTGRFLAVWLLSLPLSLTSQSGWLIVLIEPWPNMVTSHKYMSNVLRDYIEYWRYCNL